MPQITFKPSGTIVDIEPGSPLLDAAKKAGIPVETPCGGHGVCGKCLVRIESGDCTYYGVGIPEELLKEGYVLICRTKVLEGPLTVQILSNVQKEQGKFSEASEDLLKLDHKLLPQPDDIEPLNKQAVVTVQPPEMGDGLSDYDRLQKAITSELNCRDIHLPVNVLKTLPEAVREDEGHVTAAYFYPTGTASIIDITAGAKKENFGIAVDIGTTTVAVQLVDMADGTILGSKTAYNAQIECGLDVISRINYAKKPERLEELRQKVLKTINGNIHELAHQQGIKKRAILNASIAGNTTMMHLLLGIIPEHIRLEPYTPAIYDLPPYTAGEMGLDINQNAYVYSAPSVGSYVGGDITSGLLCTSLATDSEEVCLFIDIGTNGELVLGNNEFLLGCACSAGPAFEGGGIEKGMRASKGAIERVDIDPGTGKADYSTIGNEEPTGICGSGMISLISNLFETGWIDAAGKLDKRGLCPAIEVLGKNSRYNITNVNPSENKVYVTETDIDNIIRAKAAIFSACRVMLGKISMDFTDLSRIYIAGGFGRYLDIENSVRIGLLPELPPERFIFLGNSSIMGAYMTLLSKKHRDKQKDLAKKITYIDLSTEHEYMDQYTAALFLPHTDAGLFPHAKRG